MGTRIERKLVNTKNLGAAIGMTVAATGALADPGVAAAGASTHFIIPPFKCMKIGSTVPGPNRSPSFISANMFASRNCSSIVSAGWLTISIPLTHGGGTAKQYGQREVSAAWNNLGDHNQVQTKCIHNGWHHNHWAECWSYRTF